MPLKEDIIKIIKDSPHPSFSKSQCVAFVRGVRKESNPPSKLRKGDVYGWNGGAKVRPCVIIKVLADVVYGIPMSTTEDEMNLMPYNSRFFGNGWYSRAIECSKHQFVKDNFLGVHDNPKELNKAIKLIMDEFNNNIL